MLRKAPGGGGAFVLSAEDLAPAFGAFLAQLGRLLRKYQETSKDHPALNSLPFLGNQPSKQAVAALAEKIQALP